MTSPSSIPRAPSPWSTVIVIRVVATGFAKGFIQSLTIKKGATVVYQKNLKANPPANYFNDGSISNLIKGIAYKIKLGDSPDTKSATAEIDANLDGDFTDAGENASLPKNMTFTIPSFPLRPIAD